jgi:hypothetical protein
MQGVRIPGTTGTHWQHVAEATDSIVLPGLACSDASGPCNDANGELAPHRHLRGHRVSVPPDPHLPPNMHTAMAPCSRRANHGPVQRRFAISRAAPCVHRGIVCPMRASCAAPHAPHAHPWRTLGPLWRLWPSRGRASLVGSSEKRPVVKAKASKSIAI